MQRFICCNYLILLALISGCSSDNSGFTGTHLIYKEYLVDAYVKAEGMNVNLLNDVTIGIFFSGPEYSIISDNASDVAKFKELAVIHKDNFQKELAVDFSYSVGDYISYAENFNKIEVSSSISWDAEHPAGSSLGDLCYLVAYSFAPTLNGNVSAGGLTYIRKLIDELSEEDLKLLMAGSIQLGFFGQMSFMLQPQTITITVWLESGAKFTVKQKIIGTK